VSIKTHDKGPLPGKILSCGLCRALQRKTHTNRFVVRFLAVAVCLAKAVFPVVNLERRESNKMQHRRINLYCIVELNIRYYLKYQ
jgi:hypothetical protein